MGGVEDDGGSFEGASVGVCTGVNTGGGGGLIRVRISMGTGKIRSGRSFIIVFVSKDQPERSQ